MPEGTPKGNRYFNYNGQDVTIPTANADKFIKDYPDAVEVGLFNIGGKEPAVIPFSNIAKFVTDNPTVKPLYDDDINYYADVVGNQARGAVNQMMEYGKLGAKASNEPEEPKQVDWSNAAPSAAAYTGAVPDPAKMPQTLGTVSGFNKALKSAVKDTGAAFMQVGEKILTGSSTHPASVAINMLDNAVSKVIDDENTPLETRQALNDYLTQPKTILGQGAQSLHISAQKDMPQEESLATMVASIIPQMGLVVGTMFVPTLAPYTLGVMGAMGGGSQSLSYVDWIRERNKTADPTTYNPAVDAGGLLLGAAFEMAFEHFGSFARYGINKVIPKGAANTMIGKLFSTEVGEKLAENVFIDFMQKQPQLGQKLLKVGFQTLEEGGEEAGTELANILTESLSYRDDMTIGEIVKRTAMSAAAGGIMGAMISPVGTWSQNKSYDNIREQNGFVALASTKDGEAFEVLGKQGNKVFGVNAEGKQIDIDENDIEDYVKMSLDQFKNFKNVSKKGQETVIESQQSPEQQAEIQLRKDIEPFINSKDNLLHPLTISGKEGIWYELPTTEEIPNVIKAINSGNGDIEMLSLDSDKYNIAFSDPITPDQVVAEGLQALFPTTEAVEPPVNEGATAEPTTTKQLKLGKAVVPYTTDEKGTHTFDLSQEKNPEKALKNITDYFKDKPFVVYPITEKVTTPDVVTQPENPDFEEPTVIKGATTNVVKGVTVKKATTGLPMDNVQLPGQKRMSDIAKQQEIEQAAKINTEAEDKPVVVANQNKKRKSFWQPSAEAKQRASTDPMTPEEAVLQYFVLGGKISKEDFMRLTGWGANEKDPHGQTELKHYRFLWDDNGTPVDQLSLSSDTPLMEAFVERVGTNAIQQVVADVIHAHGDMKSMLKRLAQLQDIQGMSEEDMKRMDADAEYQDMLEKKEEEELYNDILSNLVETYGEPPIELFQDENTQGNNEGISGQPDNGVNAEVRNDEAGSTEGDKGTVGRGETETVIPQEVTTVVAENKASEPILTTNEGVLPQTEGQLGAKGGSVENQNVSQTEQPSVSTPAQPQLTKSDIEDQGTEPAPSEREVAGDGEKASPEAKESEKREGKVTPAETLKVGDTTKHKGKTFTVSGVSEDLKTGEKTYDIEDYQGNIIEDLPLSELNTEASIEVSDIDAALNDFMDAFNDIMPPETKIGSILKNNSDNVSFSIEQDNSAKQARLIVAGIKLIDTYTKSGVYKFADIVSSIGNKGIPLNEELISALKRVYGSYLAENDNPNLDDLKTLRSFQLTTQDESKPEPIRDTEVIATEAEIIERQSESIETPEQAGQIAEQAQGLINEIDEKLLSLMLNPGEYTTEDINHEYPNVVVEKEIKKDIVKFSKSLAKVLGWEHDTDRKGKVDYGSANIAPAGGNGTFILWHPNSDYGIYVSIPYNPDYSNGSGYDNYKIQGIGWGNDKPILWRTTEKKHKYSGHSNQYVKKNITVGEFAELIKKAIKPYVLPTLTPAENIKQKFSGENLENPKKESNFIAPKEKENEPVSEKTETTGKPIGGNTVTLDEGQRTEPVSGFVGKQNTASARTETSGGGEPSVLVNDTSGDTTGTGTGNSVESVSPGRGDGFVEETGTDSRQNVQSDINGRNKLTPEQRNHFIKPGDTIVPKGETAKIKANIDAIRLAKKLETSGKNASPAQKQVLVRYTGWGGLSNVFKYSYWDRGWKDKYEATYNELKSLLTAEEFNAAKESTINAHYTAKGVIEQMWNMVDKLGFKGGTILEPAGGIGHFLGIMPEHIANNSRQIGYELDKISGLIFQKLYPEANITVAGYETANFPNNSVDLAISNVPFGSVKVYDKQNKDISDFQIHNYFIAKSIRKLKPGGIGVFITTSATMDNEGGGKQFRTWVSSNEGGNADLIDAVRLPNNAFKENAGTEVTTDILIFRKRIADKHSAAKQFLNAETISETKTKSGDPVQIRVNEYFAKHPERMLGEMKLAYQAGGGGLYTGDSQTLAPIKGSDLKQQLTDAINTLPSNIADASGELVQYADETTQKEGSIHVIGGKPMIVKGGTFVSPDWNDNKVSGLYTKAEAVTDYNSIKEAIRSLISLETNAESTDAEIEASRKKLNKAYDSFVKKYGYLNRNVKINFLKDDIENALVFMLEKVKETESISESGISTSDFTISKSDIFSRRVNTPRTEPTKAENTSDAVNISLAYKNKIDLPYIAKLLGTDEQTAKEEIISEGLGFVNPASGAFEDRDTYLSGYVKDKLQFAKDAAALDESYNTNVKNLDGVIPDDIPYYQINMQLGAPWIPAPIIREWINKIIEVDADVNYNKTLNRWSVKGRIGNSWNSKNRTEFAGGGIEAIDLIMDALNTKSTVVMESYYEGNVKKTRKNVELTAQAQSQQTALKMAFRNFAAELSEENRDKLQRIYNDTYNAFVNKVRRDINITHFPGANKDIKLYTHQKIAAIRCLSEPTLLAHQVGTGKTFTLITAAMEMRRLGTAKKPLIVVQKATLSQFAESFKLLYPSANILIPTDKDMSAQERQNFFAKVALNDWDAVIVHHDALTRMPDDPNRQIAYINERVDELQQAMDEMDDDDRAKDGVQREIDALEEKIAKINNPTVKDEAKKSLNTKSRLAKQADRATDKVLNFEQLGVDALLVDEAHTYKRLGFATKSQGVKGIDTKGSQKSFSVMLKIRHILENNGNKNVVFATGTPISNTMAEAWTMMKYLIPNRLTEYGVSNFDEFKTTFGEVVPSVEFTAAGEFKSVERFSKYINLPELKTLFRSTADVVLTEEIGALKAGVGTPQLANDTFTTVQPDQTPELEAKMDEFKSILKKWEKLTGKEKRDKRHIPLVIFGLAKRAAIDVRLVDSSIQDDPGSKLTAVANNVFEKYTESKTWKGTQLIFADSYQSSDKRFNLYEEIKRQLVEKGVPANEIEIVNDHNSDSKRAKLFDKVNSGEVRVVLGSTDKLGIGVNVQRLLYAVHHIDAPNRPMDFEQRNGRILRQGNLHLTMGRRVHVILYGVKKSLDATAYQRLDTKNQFIRQMLNADMTERTIEDTADDAQGMTFSQMMANLSGSQYAVIHTKKSYDLKNIEVEQNLFKNRQIAANKSIYQNKQRIPTINATLEVREKALDLIKKSKIEDGITSLTFDGKTHTEPQDKKSDSLAKVLENKIESLLQKRRASGVAQTFLLEVNNELPIVVKVDIHNLTTGAEIGPAIDYSIHGIGVFALDAAVTGNSKTAVGLLISMRSILKADRVSGFIAESKAIIENLNKQNESLQEFIKNKFPKEDEIETLRAEVAELEQKMIEETATEVESIKDDVDIDSVERYHNDNATEETEDDSVTFSIETPFWNDLTPEDKQGSVTGAINEFETDIANPKRVRIGKNGKEVAEQFLQDSGNQDGHDEIVTVSKNNKLMAFNDSNTGIIYINAEHLTNRKEVFAKYIHESTHLAISDLFGGNIKNRIRFGEMIYDALGVQEIRSGIPLFYWNYPAWKQGEEYITHKAENMLYGKGIDLESALTEDELFEYYVGRKEINTTFAERYVSKLVNDIYNGRDNTTKRKITLPVVTIRTAHDNIGNTGKGKGAGITYSTGNDAVGSGDIRKTARENIAEKFNGVSLGKTKRVKKRTDRSGNETTPLEDGSPQSKSKSQREILEDKDNTISKHSTSGDKNNKIELSLDDWFDNYETIINENLDKSIVVYHGSYNKILDPKDTTEHFVKSLYATPSFVEANDYIISQSGNKEGDYGYLYKINIPLKDIVIVDDIDSGKIYSSPIYSPDEKYFRIDKLSNYKLTEVDDSWIYKNWDNPKTTLVNTELSILKSSTEDEKNNSNEKVTYIQAETEKGKVSERNSDYYKRNRPGAGEPLFVIEEWERSNLPKAAQIVTDTVKKALVDKQYLTGDNDLIDLSWAMSLLKKYNYQAIDNNHVGAAEHLMRQYGMYSQETVNKYNRFFDKAKRTADEIRTSGVMEDGVEYNKLPKTITVNGKSRPTTNSKGQPIADTEEKIRNFYAWFGESKVTDEQGRPLVVYHGTTNYEEFNKFRRGSKGYLGGGIYFSSDKLNATGYAKKNGWDGHLYEVYLNIENPLTVKGSIGADDLLKQLYGSDSVYKNRSNKQSFDTHIVQRSDINKLQDKGYDGIVWTTADEYVAWEPSQIKSIYNSGQFSPTNPNINFSVQAYHGSPHNFERFSTDYMGSGEGAQAYGWGLYFTDKKGIAEGYANLNQWSNRQEILLGNDIITLFDLERNTGWKSWIDGDIKRIVSLYESDGINALKGVKGENKGREVLQYLYNNNYKGKTGRNLYQVSLHDGKSTDQYDYLRWDKPVTETQKEKVKRTYDDITNSLADYKKASLLSREFETLDLKTLTGEDIYKRFEEVLGSDKEASLALLNAGIDGIKYPAEYTSKGTHEDSFNYVVFDENAVSVKDHITFSIAGEKAKHTQAVRDNAEVAKQMEAEGKDTKSIYLATGWERGKDGKWRYELPDATRTITDDQINNLPKQDDTYTVEVPIHEVINAPELFEAYPELKDYKVTFYNYGSQNDLNTEGFTARGTKVIGIAQPSNGIKSVRKGNRDVANDLRQGYAETGIDVKDTILSTLIHEAQHTIQKIEGFDPGTNQGEILENTIRSLDGEVQRDKRYYNLSGKERRNVIVDRLKKENNAANEADLAHKLYMKTAGEVEAQNTQKRNTLTEVQRKNTPISETESVSRDKQISSGNSTFSAAAQNINNKFNNIPPVPPTTNKTAAAPGSVNPNVDKALKENRGLKGKSIYDRLRKWKSEISALTHHFEFVREDEFPAVYDKLRQFESVPEDVRKKAFEKISDVVKPIAKDKVLFEAFERAIVLNDLWKDVNSGLFDGKELPWGYKTKDEVLADVKAINFYVNANPKLLQAILDRKAMMRGVREDLVKNGLIKAGEDNDTYFHHQVHKYWEEKDAQTTGTTSQDVRTHKKGWQYARTGSMLEYNTNYVESEFEVVAQSLQQIRIKELLNEIGTEANIVPQLMKTAEETGENWRDLIPEGFTTWYPKKGTNAYWAASVAEKAVQNVMDVDDANMLAEMTAEVNNSLWVIPKKLAAQLDSMKSIEKGNIIDSMSRSINSGWKQWILMNPYRVIKYNLNNMSGDLDIVLASNPGILKPQYAHAAFKELASHFRGGRMSRDLSDAYKYGIITSGLSVQEIPGINKQGIFQSLVETDPNLIKRAARSYWNGTKNLTQFRENMLRLAAFKYYKDKLSKGEKLYGASNHLAIDAIQDNTEKAAKIARELLGDYGNLSQGGQWMRSHIYPFWSWVEINAPRYYRLLKNTRYEGNTGYGTGARTAGVVGKKIGFNALKLAVKAQLLMILINMFNKAMFPDEDDELRKRNDRQLKLILGRDEEGNIRTLRVSGAFSDVLSWVGLEDAPQDISDVNSEQSTVEKKVEEGGSAFVNKFAQGLLPIGKTLAEIVSGKSFYPDVFNPTPIRDKAEHASKMVSADKLYRLFTKKPLKSLGKEMSGVIFYNVNPGEGAYYAMRQKAFDFLDEKGIDRGDWGYTDKGNALYYYKQSLKVKDPELAAYWWKEYLDLGGSKEDMRANVKRGEVEHTIKKELRDEWRQTLSKEELEVLEIANKWYDETYKKR